MVQTSRRQQPPNPRRRKRRQERKQPRPLHSGPGFVRGRFVSRQAAKSRRETPLRFLPAPHPASLPAPTRRLRGRRRSPFCTFPFSVYVLGGKSATALEIQQRVERSSLNPFAFVGDHQTFCVPNHTWKAANHDFSTFQSIDEGGVMPVSRYIPDY